MGFPQISVKGKLTTVFMDDMTLWFSYETFVAFRTGGAGVGSIRCVRQNEWGATTGKDLNWIDGGDKEGRFNAADFYKMWEAYTAKKELPGVLG